MSGSEETDPTEQGALLDWGNGKRQPINNLGGAEPDQTPILERSGGTQWSGEGTRRGGVPER